MVHKNGVSIVEWDTITIRLHKDQTIGMIDNDGKIKELDTNKKYVILGDLIDSIVLPSGDIVKPEFLGNEDYKDFQFQIEFI